MHSDRVNAGVVFMGGAGRSGSTLLGLMLGVHASIFYAGEAKKSLYLDNLSKPFNKRVCKLCGPECAVWGALRTGSGEDLYETLSRRTQRPIVVDSAKQLAWIESQVAVLRDVVPLYLIRLVRDGRAVVNSWLRQHPETSARDHAAAWVSQMHGSEELAASWPGSVHRMRYEEFALRPEPTLRALVDFLGIPFDPGMLEPWNSVQHPLGANDGPLFLLARERSRGDDTGAVELIPQTRHWYAAHPRGVMLDLRWKREMGAEALAAFEAVAGETNRAYAWEERVR